MKNNLIVAAIVIILIIGGVLYLGQKSKSTLPTNTGITTNKNVSNNANPEPTTLPGTDAINKFPQQITLDITSPQNGATVTTSAVTVAGKTVPNADVNVNDVSLKADAQGNFSTRLTLDEGDNMIDVVANDANGNNSEQEITVTYQLPQQ